MFRPSSSTSMSFTRSQNFIFGLMILLLVVAAFTLGFLTSQLIESRNTPFPVFSEAYRFYTQHFYEGPPEPRKIEYGMIRGMISSGNDPFTSFLEPPQNELQSNSLAGKFGGIGVRIDRDHDNNFLLYPLPDSPASKAGIIDADHLLAVDDQTITAETSTDEIQADIRGPINSTVTIKIARGPSKEEHEFKLRRIEVAAPSVTFNLAPSNPSVGVIQVNLIAESSSNEIIHAIQQLQDKGATSFILDLRNNGGGLVQSGVDCAGLFLENDVTVIEEQFRGESVKFYRTDHTGQFSDIPLVILVNQNTASAAEIFAGALQNEHRARIVGSPTFGKDSVQLVVDLQDGSSLHVTAGKWWLPEKRGEIAGKGLTPDVELSKEDASAPTALDKAAALFNP